MSELKYHARCRRVADAIGARLFGSSEFGGFTTVNQDYIGHTAMERIESLLDRLEAVERAVVACAVKLDTIDVTGDVPRPEEYRKLAEELRQALRQETKPG